MSNLAQQYQQNQQNFQNNYQQLNQISQQQIQNEQFNPYQQHYNQQPQQQQQYAQQQQQPQYSNQQYQQQQQQYQNQSTSPPSIIQNQNQMQNQQQYQAQQEPIDMAQSLDPGTMNQSYTKTDNRRKYPLDIKNRKKEYIGLEVHKKEVDQLLHQNETEIRNIKQKHLLTELDKKILQQLEEKRQDLLLKQMEGEEMAKQMDAYQVQLYKNKQDNVLLQNRLGMIYDDQKFKQVERDQQYKNAKLEWEQKLIQYNKEKMEEDEVKKKEQKEYIKQEKQGDLQREHYIKEQNHQRQFQDKLEYQDLCKINSEKEFNKEQNYRQFYRDVAENQEQLIIQHYDAVMKPLLVKQAELEAIINRNCTEYEKRRAREELEKIIRRKNELMVTKDKNLNMINNKEHQKEAQKIEQKEKVKERLEDLANYNQYLEYKQQEKVNKQLQYKDFLDQQQKEHDEKVRNAERMSKKEKELNKMDLQAFKGQDSGLYHMVPGWNPQIGQLPPRQNREQLQKDIMEAMKNPALRIDSMTKVDPSIVSVQENRSPFAKAGQSSINNNNQNVRNSMPQLPNVNQFNKIGEPAWHIQPPLVLAQSTQNKAYNQSQVYEYGHNPITNPMPKNTQNKYMAQEYMAAQQLAKPRMF